MKSYEIVINGKSFDVDVIPKKSGGVEVTRIEPMMQPSAAAKAAPAETAAKAAPAAKAAAPAAAGSRVIEAPLRGTVLKVNCKVGDAVQANTILFVVEAMKMENEIFAGQAGTVQSVDVKQGEALETGTRMAVIA
jgi:glutaconyl-CoA/methylmalonyl-CoA decarboxylase subunit gamma